MPILLRERDVEQLLTMPDALRVVEEAFRAWGEGHAQNLPRQRVRVDDGVMHLMPAGLPTFGYIGFKAYTSFHGKARFYFHLFDARSGDYLAIIEADRLGQIRTGAASGVATKYLARQAAQTVGIIGSGWQAETQLDAVRAVRPIRFIRCYSRDQAHRRAFAERISTRLNVTVRAVDSARDAVMDTEIVVTITSAGEPVLKGEWLAPGAHVNATGGNWAHRREIDTEVVKRAGLILVDSLEQARIESGDLLIPINEGALTWEQVHELSALIAGHVQGRTSEQEITLFKSNGIALEDVAVGGWVFERAREQRMGELLPL